MNCPSRTDELLDHPGWNQSPPFLNADLTTRNDFNGIINAREQRDHRLDQEGTEEDKPTQRVEPNDSSGEGARGQLPKSHGSYGLTPSPSGHAVTTSPARMNRAFTRAKEVLFKYAQFVGPGFLISVAYIDPGNYQTDINAGAATRYSLLFVVLMSNLFAIFLQSLCIKLGSVTGLNLAENCRQHLPKWLNASLYVLAEAAIIATDMAEVIGSAIALNLLLHIPLVAGCCITLVDVLVILFFYRPDGSMGRLRVFEYFVMALVLGVVTCFCIQLSYVKNTTAGEVFKGYLPSSDVVNGDGIYLSCGIIGATVMPHSIFLGSGVVQSRLRDFDVSNNITSQPTEDAKYRPSVSAIRSCLNYSIFELAFSLFAFALFVNSAILIVAGSSLYQNAQAQDTGLFGIYSLLTHTLTPAAGTIFALALLLSGTSAGIVCTMAGQMVSEGMINWTLQPWLRRLITRSISIVPSVVVAAAVGKQGLGTALTVSQVILSVILPFVSAPLIYFTCRAKYMVVPSPASEQLSTAVPQRTGTGSGDEASRQISEVERGAGPEQSGGGVCMKNSWPVAGLAVMLWLVLVVMNVALLVIVGLGKA